MPCQIFELYSEEACTPPLSDSLYLQDEMHQLDTTLLLCGRVWKTRYSWAQVRRQVAQQVVCQLQRQVRLHWPRHFRRLLGSPALRLLQRLLGSRPRRFR